MAIDFELNGKAVSLDADPDMPLLWAIRDLAGLTGTKFGCGKALCGACTVRGPPGAGRLARTQRRPVWLLPVGANHECGRPA